MTGNEPESDADRKYTGQGCPDNRRAAFFEKTYFRIAICRQNRYNEKGVSGKRQDTHASTGKRKE